MDRPRPNQLTHISYQRFSGYSFHPDSWKYPNQWNVGNPYDQRGSGHHGQIGFGNPYQRDYRKPYQRMSEDAKLEQSGSQRLKRGTKPKVITLKAKEKKLDILDMKTEKKKLLCTRCNLEFTDQNSLDEHISGSKHKNRILANQLIEELEKTEPCFNYDSIRRVYLCNACNIEVKSPQELEDHFYSKEHITQPKSYTGSVKSLPLRSDNTPCQFINPYLKANTCRSGAQSSKFWLNLISKEYKSLSFTNKQLFIEDMISQAHGCLHKGYHEQILSAISGKKSDATMVIRLREAYYAKNRALNCNCGSEMSQEELEKVRGLTAERVNPYFMDNTCEGAEKSSLFWLNKIKEDFQKLGKKKKNFFIMSMIQQAHPCLHRGYHRTIIEELSSNGDIKLNDDNGLINKLRKEYARANSKFVCTCVTEPTQKIPQIGETMDSYSEPEVNECFTYENIMSILELDD